MDFSRNTLEKTSSSQETEEPLAWIRLRKDHTAHDRLEVAQIIGSEVADVRHFSPSGQPITLGNQNKHRLRFAGKPIAWVPSFFSAFNWMMYPFVQTSVERTSDFFSVEGHQLPLFIWSNRSPVALVPNTWDGYIATKDTTLSIQQVLMQHKGVQREHYVEIPLLPQQQIVIKNKTEVYAAQLIDKKETFYVGFLHKVDGFLIGFSALILAITLSYLSVLSNVQEMEPEEDVERIYRAIVELEPEAKPEKPKPKPKPPPKPRPKPKPKKIDFKDIPKDPPKKSKEPPKDKPKNAAKGQKSKKKLRRIRMLGAKNSKLAVKSTAPVSFGGTSDGTTDGGGEPESFGVGISYTSATKQPRLKKRPPLKIPDSIKKDGIEGTVKIVIDIDATGLVVAARIKKSLREDADKACIESWKKAKFQPAKQDDQPVAVTNFPRRCRFKSMD